MQPTRSWVLPPRHGTPLLDAPPTVRYHNGASTAWIARLSNVSLHSPAPATNFKKNRRDILLLLYLAPQIATQNNKRTTCVTIYQIQISLQVG
jgi:hypothetical protein